MTPHEPGGRPDDGTDDVLPADEARIAALLRASADVGPMPDDVVARLDAALADAATTTPVASLDARRRSRVRRFQRVFATAAGIAVIAVGGGIAFVAGGQGGADDSASSGAVASEDLPATAKLLRSGKDFVDVAAVQDLAEDVVADSAAAGAADSTGAGDEAAPPEAAAPTDGTSDLGVTMFNAPGHPSPDSEAATSAEDQRAVAERVVGCTGIDADSVVVVEIAAWQGEPAAVVVHRTADGAEALVVALDCAGASDVLSRVAVPTP